MLKDVIFDLDGVITDTAIFHFIAWKKLGEKLGIVISEEFNENLKGVDRTESLRRILALGNQENHYSEAEKAEFANEKNNFYVSLIEKVTPADTLPGIATLLAELRANQIKIGLASASKNAPQILKNLGLTSQFDTIVDPATLEQGKPHPEIFSKACNQLDVLPSEAVGVEDAYSGIQSINDAHLLSIGIGDPATLNAADAVLADTSLLTYEKIIEIWQEKH
ncbi:beta-phosphoglucomutase [Enterococcus sp. PF1-24]|uniref:beta-phosphoglucomutase n=1 Tax=unclassified Enterococcus TaxID=2608891 RepID=UPI002474FB81|nr:MULTISPECIES: beta-phosphoglucomutase [unclassified Enterococcus]MDH6365322.1 beta-phosphoglucomutase [Enterococcus sp. PFB1-1]MDH6402422.1 beta-phosphoglucomutase [Enterococcus sp. PF1-24]